MRHMLHRKLHERFLPDIATGGSAGVLDNEAFKKPGFWLLAVSGVVGTVLLYKGRVLTGIALMGATMMVGALVEQKENPL